VSGRDIVQTGTNSYRLDQSRLHLDLDDFDHLMRNAANASGAERRVLLESAVAMSGVDLFDDSPDRGWAQSMRLTHRETVAWAHRLLADDAIGECDLHRVVWHGEQALRYTPYAEHAFRVLMVAHVGLGSRELARLTHRRCINTLWRHLRLDPTGHTVLVAAAVEAGATFDELVSLLAPAAAA
jgi:DNA-binding SARP family transcriptional activator